MKFRIRPLNQMETFCCSPMIVKNMFASTEICINFAYFGRNYTTMVGTPQDWYHKNKIKGRVIASFYMESGLESPILSFYVVQKKDFSQSQKRKFEETYLPTFFDIYKMMVDESRLIASRLEVIVELKEGSMVLHRNKLN